MTSYDRITVAARAFCVAAIFGLALLSGDPQAVQSTIVLAVLAASTSAASASARFNPVWAAALEAAFVGLLVGLMLPSASGLLMLPYLVVPALAAGLSSGLRGLAAVLTLEAASVAGLPALVAPEVQLSNTLSQVGPWLLTSLGVGLLGVWLRHFTNVAPPIDDSYESARRLLTQLRTVTRRLPTGLDTGSLAVQLLAAVAEELKADRAAVFVRTEGGVLTPLGYFGDARGELLPHDETLRTCWVETEPVVSQLPPPTHFHRAGLPLRVGARVFGVVLADCSASPSRIELAQLMHLVDQHSLRLDTALTFDELRAAATQEERQRLAREIHDGVAQEVASLGYVVDEIAAQAVPNDVKSQLTALRAELTRIVGELRHSIFELRSEVNSSAGLGTALSDYARTVGTRYGIKVHLTLEESSTRLRSEVETELLRIAQEAITNARKHAQPRNLWVDCRISPPFARIAVRDDGSGLTQIKDGSYGLKIMRERASRVDATLQINSPQSCHEGAGTSVVVTVGSELSGGSRVEDGA